MLFLIFVIVGASVIVLLYRDELRRAIRDTCQHGIAHDSYCVECQARRDKRDR